MARYIRFTATEASENWVQIFEIMFNESEGALGDDTIDIASSTFEDGTLYNLYDRDLTTAFAPTAVKDGDTLNFDMTTITDVGNLMIMQDAEAISNAVVSVKGVDGTWKEVGTLNKELTTLAINDTITEVQLTFNSANPAPVIYEIIAQEQSEDPGDQETASEAAIAALQNMVDKAIALGSDDAALTEAIANAQAVLAKEAPTVTEVVTALLNLSEAMQDLDQEASEDALRADIQATIDFINENILNNVEGIRPAKVQALKDAVQAAQTLVNNPGATVDELKAANKAMTKAAQELWEIVSKAELNALIEAANGYLDGDYTTESLDALQAAIESAQTVAINDNATTAEVTEAITNLSDAIANLETITLDTSALEHEIELVTEMIANIGNYVPSSVEGLQEKLDAAKTALNNATTQAEIDEATKTLREARLNARTKADTSALEELIAYVNSLDLSAYTTESAQAVIQEAARAEIMTNDPEITQAEVDDMVKTLQASVDNLVEVKNSTNAEDTTNTAAAAQTGLFAGVLAAAAGALLAIRRRKNQE